MGSCSTVLHAPPCFHVLAVRLRRYMGYCCTMLHAPPCFHVLAVRLRRYMGYCCTMLHAPSCFHVLDVRLRRQLAGRDTMARDVSHNKCSSCDTPMQGHLKCSSSGIFAASVWRVVCVCVCVDADGDVYPYLEDDGSKGYECREAHRSCRAKPAAKGAQ